MLSPQSIYGLLGSCGVRRRRPPKVTAAQLLGGLVFHVVAGPSKLAAHVNQLTGQNITDGALAQRRALLPLEVFEGLMSAALKPKAVPSRHPEAFYQGQRLCGLDGSTFSVANTPQVKQRCARRAAGAAGPRFPKWVWPCWWNWGVHNPAGGGVGGRGRIGNGPGQTPGLGPTAAEPAPQ